ncbi:MAG: 5-oxoprolinase subunit PxpA, partial [Actinomycetota bacterium]
MTTIDLNADLGEGMGDDDAMLDIVSSANVACGAHAGDVETMYRTLAAAAERGVVVGAHPGYPDREGFGRRVIPMAPDEVGRMVVAQVGALRAVATHVPIDVGYVKPHGALANLAGRDRSIAEAIASAVARYDPELPLLAISENTLTPERRAACSSSV